MFNNKSLQSLRADENTVGHGNEDRSGLTNNEVRAIVKTACRFGIWLYFQGMSQDQSRMMARGLFRKNHSEETPLPSDVELKARIGELIDESTGKSYMEVISDTLRDEWGQSDATHVAMAILEEMSDMFDEAPTAAWCNFIHHQVDALGDNFMKGAEMRQLNSFLDENDSIN